MNVLKAINDRSDSIDVIVKNIFITSPNTLTIVSENELKFFKYTTNTTPRRGYKISLINSNLNKSTLEGIRSFSVSKSRDVELIKDGYTSPSYSNKIEIKLSYELTEEMLKYLIDNFNAFVEYSHYSFNYIKF